MFQILDSANIVFGVATSTSRMAYFLSIPIRKYSPSPFQQRASGELRTFFPLVSLWALTQRDRAGVMPATGAIGVDEANMRAVLSRLMRVRASGVVGLVLRFAL